MVQLFNAIQQSQAANVAASDDLKVARGNGKPSLPAQSIDPLGKGKNKGKNKDNVIGRGKAGVHKLLECVLSLLKLKICSSC